MNVGLVTGFIVGGMLLLALMALNMRISQNSGLVAMNQMTKQRVEAIAEIVSSDLRNIGQGISGQAILQATNNSITFTGRQANDSLVTLTWRYLVNEPVSSTVNPDDRILRRIVNTDSITINFGVSRFDFTYFDANGNTTLIPANIRRIRIEVMCESDEPYGTEYARSFWESDITPRAIQ
jgi:hypothetical protein